MIRYYNEAGKLKIEKKMKLSKVLDNLPKAAKDLDIQAVVILMVGSDGTISSQNWNIENCCMKRLCETVAANTELPVCTTSVH